MSRFYYCVCHLRSHLVACEVSPGKTCCGLLCEDYFGESRCPHNRQPEYETEVSLIDCVILECVNKDTSKSVFREANRYAWDQCAGLCPGSFRGYEGSDLIKIADDIKAEFPSAEDIAAIRIGDDDRTSFFLLLEEGHARNWASDDDRDFATMLRFNHEARRRFDNKLSFNASNDVSHYTVNLFLQGVLIMEKSLGLLTQNNEGFNGREEWLLHQTRQGLTSDQAAENWNALSDDERKAIDSRLWKTVKDGSAFRQNRRRKQIKKRKDNS